MNTRRRSPRSTRLCRCSRTDSTTRPDTRGAASTTAPTTRSRSCCVRHPRSSRSTDRNSRPGASLSSSTAPTRSSAPSRSSTPRSRDGALRSPRATANTSAACGHCGYSCGCSRSPSRLNSSRCAATSASLPGAAATTESRPASSARRTGRDSPRNRVRSWSVTSPSDSAQASRSTSVTVSSSSPAPTASRARLTTARFSRTGIASGCGPSAHTPASTARSASRSSPSGVVDPASARYSAPISSSSAPPRCSTVTRSPTEAINSSCAASRSAYECW